MAPSIAHPPAGPPRPRHKRGRLVPLSLRVVCPTRGPPYSPRLRSHCCIRRQNVRLITRSVGFTRSGPARSQRRQSRQIPTRGSAPVRFATARSAGTAGWLGRPGPFVEDPAAGRAAKTSGGPLFASRCRARRPRARTPLTPPR